MYTFYDNVSDYFWTHSLKRSIEIVLWDYLFLANYLWMIKFSVQKYIEKKKWKCEARKGIVLKYYIVYSHQASNSIFCRSFKLHLIGFLYNVNFRKRHFSVLNVVMKLFQFQRKWKELHNSSKSIWGKFFLSFLPIFHALIPFQIWKTRMTLRFLSILKKTSYLQMESFDRIEARWYRIAFQSFK